MVLCAGSKSSSPWTLKDHSKQLCDKLQSLRSDMNFVDLDLVCEDAHLHLHKVIMAASSKFFKEQLSKSVTTVRSAPVILKLEDFNMKLKNPLQASNLSSSVASMKNTSPKS